MQRAQCSGSILLDSAGDRSRGKAPACDHLADGECNSQKYSHQTGTVLSASQKYTGLPGHR